MKIAKAPVTTKARLATREKMFQTAGRPFVVMASLKTGISAIVIAPPEISAKSRSGRLLATLKASSSCDRLNCRAMMLVRTKATILSNPKKKIKINDERVRWVSFFMEARKIMNNE